MRFYTQQHQFYCGIDLHARTMSLCILNRDGVAARGSAPAVQKSVEVELALIGYYSSSEKVSCAIRLPERRASHSSASSRA